MADEEPDAHRGRVSGPDAAARPVTRTDGDDGPDGPWPVRRRTVMVAATTRGDRSLAPRPPRRHPLAVFAILFAVITLLLGPSLAAASERTVIVVGMQMETTFYGRGWGHGVGLSQYGARGRALAGHTAQQILAHYYAGATLGTKDPTSQIRVLILTGFAATAGNPAIAHGRGGAWTIDGIATTFPANAKLTLAPTSVGATTWALRVVSSGGTQLHASTVSSGLVLRPAESASLLQLDSKPSSYDTYRGVLRFYLSTTVRVVNELQLDTYLRGVVPAEMPASWPAEAIKAQTIAARSYAARKLRPGEATYDVFDDTRSQVYRGFEGEAAATNAAIAASSGVVLKSGSSIANALFHSTGGGATEHNENVFVSAQARSSRGRSATCAVRRTVRRTALPTTPARHSRPGRPRPTRAPSSRRSSPPTAARMSARTSPWT